MKAGPHHKGKATRGGGGVALSRHSLAQMTFAIAVGGGALLQAGQLHAVACFGEGQ